MPLRRRRFGLSLECQRIVHELVPVIVLFCGALVAGIAVAIAITGRGLP